MITASEFIKWMEIFNITTGAPVVTYPITMDKGGTGANLTPTENALIYSTATDMQLLPVVASGVLTTDGGGVPALRTTLPAGLTVPDYLALVGGTMSGVIDMGTNRITNAGAPTLGSDLVTLNFLNNRIENVHPACNFATTLDLNTWVYDNGAAGVGATLTAPVNDATIIDGATPVDGDSILLINQTSNPAWQGAYSIVQGTAGTPTVLTRRSDFDEASEINAGDKIAVVGGVTQKGTQWMMSQTAAITVGTTPITFIQMTSTGSLQKSANLSDLDSASTARTNLGLGSMALQQANNVAITGGTANFVTLTAPMRYENAAVNTQLVPGDSNTFFELSVGGVTIEDDVGLALFDAGFTVALKNTSGADCFFQPFGTETVDGVTGLYTLAPMDGVIFVKSPTGWLIKARKLTNALPPIDMQQSFLLGGM